MVAEFDKGSQPFIRASDKTLFVVAMLHQMSFPNGRIRCFKRKGTDSGHVVAALIHKHRPG